jgi:regulator of sigma E protease
VLASDIVPGETYPADESGFVTGDRIVKVNGRDITNYHDIQEAITPNADRDLQVTVERDGGPAGPKTADLRVRPALDKNTGAGKIGVYFWTDPVVGTVAPESAAAIAGIQSGDRILKINGEDFHYSVEMIKILQNQPPVLTLEYERDGNTNTADVVVSYSEGTAGDIGIAYETIRYHTPSYSLPGAIVKGVQETWKTFVISAKSLTLLFRGIDLTKAVSGPVRITYMVGDVATEGFGQGIGEGFSSVANFLALISIALCIMNLLPLPVLDGGMIVLFIVEMIKGHPLNPKAINAFQTAGVVLIFGLMIFAVFGDILFLVHR